VLAFLTASVSIFMILLHCENPEGDWVAMLLGLFAAACATISLSSGLLVWPVLVLVCLVEHASRKTVSTVVIAGVSIWIFYFIGYRTSSYLGNPGVSLMHPVGVMSFAFTYLASALSSTPSRFAGIFGFVSLAFGAVGFFRYVQVRVEPFWRRRAFFVYLALFIVGTSLITALGRLNFGLGQAVVSRYRTPTLIFWASILALSASWWSRRAGEVGTSLGAPILAVLFLAVFVLPVQQPSIERFARLSRRINDSSIALAFDVNDKVYGDFFSLRPDLARRYVPFLRENHLSVFADRLFAGRGEALNALFVGVSAQGCYGRFEGLRLLEGGSKEKGAVFGWGWLRDESRGPENIVVCDDRGTVVGLAHGSERRPDVVAFFRNPKMLATGWSGYFHAESSVKLFTAYAVLLDGKTLCPLGQVVPHW